MFHLITFINYYKKSVIVNKLNTINKTFINI